MLLLLPSCSHELLSATQHNTATSNVVLMVPTAYRFEGNGNALQSLINDPITAGALHSLSHMPHGRQHKAIDTLFHPASTTHHTAGSSTTTCYPSKLLAGSRWPRWLFLLGLGATVRTI